MGGIFLDAAYHDRIISIQEIKTGFSGKKVEKTAHFWP